MQIIRLKGPTALDLANYITETLGKAPASDLQYIEIRAGDPSGQPEGCDEVDVFAQIGTTLGIDD